jgi:hypothetical protein
MTETLPAAEPDTADRKDRWEEVRLLMQEHAHLLRAQGTKKPAGQTKARR